MNTRIYAVAEGDTMRLVEATGPAQALKHVVMPRFTVAIATSKVVAQHMASGVRLEQAKPEQSEP